MKGPPVEAGAARVNPLPVTLDLTTSEDRLPNPNVRLGIETDDEPLFVNLTLSLMVAKPYLSKMNWLLTAMLGVP